MQKFWKNLMKRVFNREKNSDIPAGNHRSWLLIDKKFEYNIKAGDLKVLAVYSNNPGRYLILVKTTDYTKAVLKFFEYADSSFIDNMNPFLDSGALQCQVFFEQLQGMDIKVAYQNIKADLSQNDLINNGDSLVF